MSMRASLNRESATDRLTRAWSRPPGFVGWMMAVNHRAVGVRYIVTAFIFFILAGILALAMRVQLAQPMLEVLSPDRYNQFFTMHGTMMMFLFAVPMLEGLGIYLVPLMIGARDMAFPRLNAFGYWVYLVAGIILFGSVAVGVAADSGWFNYPPLTGPGFRPSFTGGVGIDYWLIGVTMLEVAALVAAVELIVTVFKFRAPGLSMNRMTIFVWAVLVTAFMILFAMPVLMIVSIMLELDRKIGTHFFNVAAGGHHLLWQHLFWFFGHPDVYIMQLPAFGALSMIIPAAVRRPIAGYTLIAMALVAVGFLSFGLWVHHMYATGLALMGLSFFGAASMMITLPSGVQVFAWIATIWRGALTMSTHFLYAMGAIVIFIMGGFTGVMIASPAFDWQVHDTFFIVAHFHYVLLGAVIFPIFAALYYWLPKITGRMLSRRLGAIGFWLTFIGFHITFFPMHILGFMGMVRRIYTYLPGLGLGDLNLLSTAGAMMLGLGALVFMLDFGISLMFGKRANDDPWDAGTLEWATTSPPQQYNFHHIPVVGGRYPLWEQESLAPPAGREPRGWRDLSDTPHLLREQYVTSMLDAVPDAKVFLPAPTIWPFWAAMGVTVAFAGFLTFVGFGAEMILVPIGAVITYVALLAWAWPRDTVEIAQSRGDGDDPALLPNLISGPRAPMWWGTVFFLVIVGVVLATLVLSYFYLRLDILHWPPAGIEPPDVLLPGIATVILLASVVPIWIAEGGIRAGNQSRLRIGLLVGLVLAAAFLIVMAIDFGGLPYDWTVNAYTSIVWLIGWVFGMQVAALILLGVPVGILAWQGYFNRWRHMAVQCIALYWYFVAAMWIPLFATIYLAPRIV
jgi:cytochrome c oxidase subunit I+III